MRPPWFSSHLRSCGLGLVVLLAASPVIAGPLEDARHLSANPDNPQMSIGWRGQMRAMLGGELPAVGDPDVGGIFLRVPASVELHNVVNNATPNNFWRGLLGLSVGYQLPPGTRFPNGGSLALQLQHESDHETVDLFRYFGTPVVSDTAPVGYFQFNSLGLRADAPFQPVGQAVVATVVARFHMLSCNVNLVLCANGRKGYGSQAFEADVEAAWTGRAGTPESGRFRPLVALYGSILTPSALIHEEHRVALNAGTWLPTRKRGNFELYLQAFAGNDVGYLRDRRVTQWGAAFRWAPP